MVHPPTFGEVRSLTDGKSGVIENEFRALSLFDQFKVGDGENTKIPVHNTPCLNNPLPQNEFELAAP